MKSFQKIQKTNKIYEAKVQKWEVTTISKRIKKKSSDFGFKYSSPKYQVAVLCQSEATDLATEVVKSYTTGSAFLFVKLSSCLIHK